MTARSATVDCVFPESKFSDEAVVMTLSISAISRTIVEIHQCLLVGAHIDQLLAGAIYERGLSRYLVSRCYVALSLSHVDTLNSASHCIAV